MNKILFSLFSISAILFFSGPVLQGIDLVSQFDNDVSITKFIEESSFDILVLSFQELSPEADFEIIKKALWDKLSLRSSADNDRFMEHLSRNLVFNGKKMRYHLEKIGAPPPSGYPLYIALHGGGESSTWENDTQWEYMKFYYKNSVKNGIYIAPRGVTDTWNLHFVSESYSLYERLIENMILFENVDPNRIYLLGFSAGGDGVYQIASRMPDRWAGANMSAGHSNSVNLANLKNTPFLMQMGEMDSSYNRNKNVVENLLQLKKFRETFGGYPHELFLHSSGSHNSWSDNDPVGSPRPIVDDPLKWLRSNRKEVRYQNTNAVHWLGQHKRNPIPNKLIWNSTTTTALGVSDTALYLESPQAKNRIGNYRRLFYWLDLNNNPVNSNLGEIIASCDTFHNSINIEAIGDSVNLRVLLNDKMVDFNKPITVTVKGKEVASISLTPELSVMTRTFLERSDPNYCFQSEFELVSDAFGRWQVVKH